MSMLTDSSEIREAMGLIHDILVEQESMIDTSAPRRRDVGRNLPPIVDHVAPPASVEDMESDPVEVLPPETAIPSNGAHPIPDDIEEVEGEFRGDRLENVLVAMCRRGGLNGAVVSDNSGLPLAVFNSPVDADSIAAFTSVLGDALNKADRFLEQRGADYISMDVNYEDKVAVRRFSAGGTDLYLMVLCGQAVDERSEMEVSIRQIASILE